MVCAAPFSLCAAAASVGRSPARDADEISRSAAIAVSRNFASSELIAVASSPSHAARISRSIAAAGFAGAGVEVDDEEGRAAREVIGYRDAVGGRDRDAVGRWRHANAYLSAFHGRMEI